jgi:hypothetical protein
MNLSQANAGAIVRNVLDLLDAANESQAVISEEDWSSAIQFLKETISYRNVVQSAAGHVIIEMLEQVRKLA